MQIGLNDVNSTFKMEFTTKTHFLIISIIQNLIYLYERKNYE